MFKSWFVFLKMFSFAFIVEAENSNLLKQMKNGYLQSELLGPKIDTH